MKILAIEQEMPGVEWATVSTELMAQEARDVYQMYLSGYLREHYFNENKCAVLVLECESKTQAQTLLARLPLVTQNLISFELMELRPYDGYDRIIGR
jgi:hypothetical protein